MDILTLIYEIQKDKKIIKIFDDNFVRKNKSRYKIIYENKIYPLQSEFIVKQNDITKLKIKLIHFNICFNIKLITKRCKSFRYKNYLKKNDKYTILDKFFISYQIRPNEKEIKIFGEEFVNINRQNCHILYNGKDLPLQSYLKVEDNDDNLEILLIIINEISNLRYMFYKCDSLKYIFNDRYEGELKEGQSKEEKELDPKDSEINKAFYPDNKYINSNISLETIKNNKNYSNKTEIDERIQFLSYFISKFKYNYINVTDMSYMFYGCSSLISLPDISKWNTNNVTDMNYMFYECSSLITLPDISKWNTNKVIDKMD